ncbi:MAG: cytochrome c oxidase subunit II [Betaproteobacteria bacterium RBG_16_66_20]|nr:MAG: cytochrome c oxidase subunit II [Betaproteobacteria bacterium RBG_16_66_20]
MKACKPARGIATRAAQLLAVISGWALSGLALAAEWNLRPAGSKIATEIHDLHEYVMILCTVIFVGVFSFMFWSVYAHRKSKGHKAAQFHENTTIEILWTVIPAIILVIIALPATRVVIAQKDTSNPDLTIKVTGYQWKWGYDYVKGEGEGISFISTLATPREQIENRAPKGEHYLLEVDNELVVPVGKKVRILTTAADVIHSWWMPSFGAKQDAIPGFIRDMHFRAEQTGTFRSQCVELCGKEHGFMPIVVKVVTQDEYGKWVGDKMKLIAAAADDPNKQYALDELRTRGEQVYAKNCVACHQATGKGMPPAFPPLDGAKIVLGPKDEQIRIVLNGRPKTAMAAFGGQLNDVELAALVTFTRNNWSNKTGEAIQPAEVKALRK